MKNILIVLFFLILGCTPKQQILSPSVNKNESSIIDVSIKFDVNISFIIENISDKTVNIYQPEKLMIERFNNGVWEHLKILSCPCGAPCARPSEFLNIPAGKNYLYSWDKYESWCGEKNEMGIPKTNKSLSGSGKYRIRILYNIEQNKQLVFYKEFEI